MGIFQSKHDYVVSIVCTVRFVRLGTWGFMICRTETVLTSSFGARNSSHVTSMEKLLFFNSFFEVMYTYKSH